jgi:hypothetical protein
MRTWPRAKRSLVAAIDKNKTKEYLKMFCSPQQFWIARGGQKLGLSKHGKGVIHL